ncbi:methyl-accepting chemotaxis protein [Dankookia sp. GCM10030260]|uniref:methyl-accepting chemotaxis protein n=1 Tax=Dankookia sp. GCM10030260 TaxID=3273390 RepID=UPI0036211817
MFGSFKRDAGAAPRLAALDAVHTRIMVADDDLTITYMNPAVVELMREAEADLRRELPRFNLATLIGSNIDVFHKNPTHQRQMLAGLNKPHAATIKVGRHVFDLLVTPLRQDGRRLGYVVEWADAKERLLNLDYAAQMKAVDRAQAVVAFAPDGTLLQANENFLQAMGYSPAEVAGKHQSMFIDPAQRDSADYKEFWAALRRGEPQAGQFRRIGKGGRPVWVEGSYNPILDMHGKVTKVVKFASDVTSQIALLADLKKLIDINFGEIDGAIDRSTREAGSASHAAEETSSNVQMVAASAEELAASIAEIAHNMAKSRTATEDAFAQANAGGESTGQLTNAAQAMNGVVGLIQGIAGQINLLALNATIEAARAGDAGKGFAVVASEVKNLANQAAKATEQISREIEGIQATSATVAAALTAIRGAVEAVREHVAVTASAVEEQSAVTRSMSANMQSAANAVQTVSGNITEIASAVHQAAGAVTKTKEAAAVLVH